MTVKLRCIDANGELNICTMFTSSLGDIDVLPLQMFWFTSLYGKNRNKSQFNMQNSNSTVIHLVNFIFFCEKNKRHTRTTTTSNLIHMLICIWQNTVHDSKRFHEKNRFVAKIHCESMRAFARVFSSKMCDRKQQNIKQISRWRGESMKQMEKIIMMKTLTRINCFVRKYVCSKSISTQK